ncbi:MAG: hypothetical protein JWP11_3410 [Frankiales bacterium]|nr:hypothetical protein [Frankiales bacterium]
MNAGSVTELTRALTAFAHPRTPGRIGALLRKDGPAGLDEVLATFDADLQRQIHERALQLDARDVGAILWGDDRYPDRLASAPGAPPLIFFWGNAELLSQRGLSMCGSRHVSDLGLQAASICGGEVARRGMVVMSGYARGVDEATHLAALEQGGCTVVVLAEGIDHFRRKRTYPPEHFTPERVCAVSQFPPSQPWTAGGAMTRNAVIVGLGLALVVVEAGERGGTLAAGEHALKVGRRVLALDFDAHTPVGNRMLLERGAVAVRNRQDLLDQVELLSEASLVQLTLT